MFGGQLDMVSAVSMEVDFSKDMTAAELWLHGNGCGKIFLDLDKPWWEREYSLYTYDLRRDFIKLFGFAVLTRCTVDLLKWFGPILEIGAGSGYWASELSQAGVDIIATDSQTGRYYFKHGNYFEVSKCSATDASAAHPDRALMIVWPCYDDPWAFAALSAYKGNTVIYVGESQGGCTATDSFFELLTSDWVKIESHYIPQFPGIHDALYIYRRKDA